MGVESLVVDGLVTLCKYFIYVKNCFFATTIFSFIVDVYIIQIGVSHREVFALWHSQVFVVF